MTFPEAIAAMLDGKLCKRPNTEPIGFDWPGGPEPKSAWLAGFKPRGDGTLVACYAAGFRKQDLSANDWELVE